MTHIAKEAVFNSSRPIFSATDFLSLNYQRINDLFSSYDDISSITKKKIFSKIICDTLMVSMRAEEELFFPEAKKCLKEKGLLSAIIMEHSILKYLVNEIEDLDVDSAIYDIKMKVLGEHVKLLIKEKQSKLFPKVIASGKVDLWRLGIELSTAKVA